MNEKELHRDKVFMKLFLTSSYKNVTQEEVDYFRENPELIDEVTAPVNVHKWFLVGRHNTWCHSRRLIQDAQV